MHILSFNSSLVQLSPFSQAGIETQKNYLPVFSLVVSGRGKDTQSVSWASSYDVCFTTSARCHQVDAGKEGHKSKEPRHDPNWARDAGYP